MVHGMYITYTEEELWNAYTQAEAAFWNASSAAAADRWRAEFHLIKDALQARSSR